MIDITGPVENARALPESQGRCRAIIESLPRGVVVTRHGTVLFLNTEAARLLDVPAEDLLGMSVTPLLDPADLEQASEFAHLTEAVGTAAPPVNYRLTKSGAAKDVAALSTPATFGASRSREAASGTSVPSAECRVAARHAAEDRTLVTVASGEPLASVIEGVFASLEALVAGCTAAVVSRGGPRRASVIGTPLPCDLVDAVLSHFRRLVAASERDRARRGALPSDTAEAADSDTVSGLASRTRIVRLIDERLAARRDRASATPLVAVIMVGIDDFPSLVHALGDSAADDLLDAVAATTKRTASAVAPRCL